MHTFGDENIFADEFHARLIVRLVAAVLGDAHDARHDAAHGTIVAVENFRAGKAGIDFNAEAFGLGCQPAADIAKRHGIVAMIVHERRHEKIRHAERALGAEHIEAVFSHGGVEGCALFLPVGNEFIEGDGVHHGARKNMGADFRAFFQHANRDIGGELFQADGGGEARRAGANDDDIIFHRFALNLLHRQFSSKGMRFRIAPVIVA